MKFYIDTCVWIDFVEGRTDEDIFTRIIENEDILLISEILTQELYRYINPNSTRIIFAMLYSKELLEEINTNNSQENEAKTLSKDRCVPFGDALHAIIARDNDAQLITRDRHFLKLKDVCNMELL